MHNQPGVVYARKLCGAIFVLTTTNHHPREGACNLSNLRPDSERLGGALESSFGFTHKFLMLLENFLLYCIA